MTDPTAQVLQWVRAGYADGIPEGDYPALIGLLRRRLTTSELHGAAAQLASLSQGQTLDQAQVTTLLDSPQEPSADDIRRVSVQLVIGGWPLAEADETDDEPHAGSVLSRVIGWLRAGYPEGVPPKDYIPLLALLQRRLTKAEVKQVAKSLRRSGVSPATPANVGAAIEDVIRQSPSEADVERVRARLEDKGWPIDWTEPPA